MKFTGFRFHHGIYLLRTLEVCHHLSVWSMIFLTYIFKNSTNFSFIRTIIRKLNRPTYSAYHSWQGLSKLGSSHYSYYQYFLLIPLSIIKTKKKRKFYTKRKLKYFCISFIKKNNNKIYPNWDHKKKDNISSYRKDIASYTS